MRGKLGAFTSQSFLFGGVVFVVANVVVIVATVAIAVVIVVAVVVVVIIVFVVIVVVFIALRRRCLLFNRIIHKHGFNFGSTSFTPSLFVYSTFTRMRSFLSFLGTKSCLIEGLSLH